MSGDWIQKLFDQKRTTNKDVFCHAMPFAFNAVELYVETIIVIPWTLAREVCRAFEYNKKTTDVVKAFCSKENYAQKYQMSSVIAVGKRVDWPKDS